VQTLKGHDKGVICLALNDIAESWLVIFIKVMRNQSSYIK
jgi:hypothetical protein